MKHNDLVRLKKATSAKGITFKAGTRGQVVSCENGSSLHVAEIKLLETNDDAVLKVAQADLLPSGDVEITQSFPFNMVSIRPIEKLNRDIKVEINTVSSTEGGTTFYSTSTTWLLFDDITTFINELASLKAKELNKIEFTSAANGEFALQLWQRHGKPIANIWIGKDSTVQNQVHHEQLAIAYEVDSTLQDVIDGFRKLAFGEVRDFN